ncbi:MAG: phage protein Gp37 [Pseudomonadota bacterium]
MTDTPGYTIQQIEDALVTRLKALKRNDSIRLRTLGTYQGELETQEEVEGLTRLFPAIWAMYAGSSFARHGSRRIERMRFCLFACARSFRDEAGARRGGATGPGAYAILAAARDLLCGSRLGLSIEPLSPTRQETAWFGKGISVYVQEWETANFHLFEGD